MFLRSASVTADCNFRNFWKFGWLLNSSSYFYGVFFFSSVPWEVIDPVEVCVILVFLDASISTACVDARSLQQTRGYLGVTQVLDLDPAL